MDVLEVPEHTMEILGKVMNSCFYIYSLDFLDFEESHESDAIEELAESPAFLLCDPFHN